MRTRLNPDASKMIICTTGGYLILIHDLDLRTLAQDLEGFKVSLVILTTAYDESFWMLIIL